MKRVYFYDGIGLERIIIKALIAMLFASVAFFAAGVPVNARSYDWTTAKSISVNEAVEGNILKGYYYEKDLYKFEIPNDGVVSVEFTNPLQADSDTYWEVYLFDSAYNELYKRNIKGNRQNHSLTKMGLAAGTYYLCVNSPEYTPTKSADTYVINAVYTESSQWEKELNEDFKTATPVQLNTDYYGTTSSGYYYEKDYYCFELSSPGKVSIEVAHDQLGSSDNCYDVSLYHSDYSKIFSRSLSGAYASHQLVSVGLPAGKYYFSIQSPDYTPAITTQMYTINVGFEGTDVWEKEFNNKFNSATEISPDTYYSGTICSKDDVDYYAFDISESNSYEIEMLTEQQNSTNNYYTVTLCDSEYGELSNMSLSGNLTQHIMNEQLSAGRYYIMVKGLSSTYTTAPYSMQVRVYTETQDDTSADPSDPDNTYDDTDYQNTDLSVADVYLSNYDFTYTGKEICPSLFVMLGDKEIDPDNYYVYYYDNVNAGTATIIVEAADGSIYTGTTSTTFNIAKRKLTKENVYVNDLTYNGKSRKPVVHCYFWDEEGDGDFLEKSLKLNKQYKITKGSKSFKKIKKYTFTIKGNGNYTGSVKMKFTIRPKAPKGIKTAKRGKKTVTVKWKKQKGVDGYCVRTYNSKGKARNHYTKKTKYVLKADKNYYVGADIYTYKKVGKKKILSSSKWFYDYVKPTAKPSFSVNRDFGKYVINYKRYGDYMVEFSKTKDFSNATGSNFWKGYTDKLTRNLSSCYGKTEWFRTRQYTTTRSGKILAGPWSKPRKVRVY